jgi:hypothetical protein
MTGAERLKISYIFLILAALFTGRVRLLLLSISPLAHLQSILVLISVVTAFFEGFIKKLIFRFSVSKRAIRSLLLLSGVVVIFGYFLSEGVLRKAMDYASGDILLFELVNAGILSLIALYVSHKRLQMFLILFPLIPAIAILGGARVNMIAFTLVIYYLMVERRLHHPLIYLLMMYFSIKTITFINGIFLYGDGFAS